VLIFMNPRKFKENSMHVDEGKKFDKRNILRNIKNGLITQKDYEVFLSKLPDASNKLFSTEEAPTDSAEPEAREMSETPSKKKAARKRAKGKGK
jgi:hypothetical protein